ncbi:MAG: YMGG-like glycine zipper-containing protein [Parvularculaceae bacterium]
MSTRMMVAAGVCGAALLAGAGLAMSARDTGAGEAVAEAAAVQTDLATADIEAAEIVEPQTMAAIEEPVAEPVRVIAAPTRDCRDVAATEAAFDPATTQYPTREDAGNRQVLKGAAVGAAAGAIGGEVIADRAGKGAAVGAAAGALGGHVLKKKKQKAADERYDQGVAAYNQSKAQYDAALHTCLAG